jgi:hypothetical protein
MVFTDSKGTRHSNVKVPASLMRPGVSRRQQEAYLIKSGQIPDPAAPPAPEPVEVVIEEVRANEQAAANEALAQLRAQLDELQGKLDGQPLSQAELVAARQEIGDYLLKAADAAAQLVQVEGRGSQLKAELTAIAEPLNEQAAETARQQAEVNEVQERVLGDLQAQAAALLEGLTQDAAAVRADAIDSSVAEAAKVAVPEAARVAREVANKHWGSSVTIAPEDPSEVEASSFAQRWFGRDFLIPGDGVFVTSKEGITAHRFVGGTGWVKSAELLPKVVTATGPSILDNSTKVNSPITVVRPGAGGGAGSGERLLRSSAAYNLGVTIADSSNWATTTQDPTSGNLLLEVTAVDGSFAGKKGFASVAFNYSAGVSESVEYALLGDLATTFRFDLTVGRSPASVPSGITATLPAGKTRTTLTLQILPDSGGTGGVTQFLLSGVVLWTFKAMGRAQDRDTATEQPAWNWV